MASILPQQIPPQGTPFDTGGKTYVALDWYLFLYNLAAQTLAGQNGGNVPTSQADIIDMVDLDAAGADTAVLPKREINIQALLPDADVVPSLRDVTNALTLASDVLLPDPPPPAGAVIPITPGASPYTYTAIHDGTLIVSGVSATMNVIRYGVSVAAGVTAGPVPMRENDQLTLSWTGGTAPTMNFLPNK